MLWVPRTYDDIQAAPKKPAHNPMRVDTMYQVGGSASLVMAVRACRLPVKPAVTATDRAART